MKQVRIPIPELPQVMTDVVNSTKTWEDMLQKYPVQEQKDEAPAAQ